MTRRTATRLLVLAFLATAASGCSYNRFVSQEEALKAQWAQVESQLQRRNDLIPNLVETVKGYAQHEEGVFKEIADARAKLDRGTDHFQPFLASPCLQSLVAETRQKLFRQKVRHLKIILGYKDRWDGRAFLLNKKVKVSGDGQTVILS